MLGVGVGIGMTPPPPSIEGIWGPGNNLELWAMKSEFQCI